MSSYIVYASNSDSTSIFKNNKPDDFVLKLDKSFHFQKNSTIELVEFRCRQRGKGRTTFYVMTDICETSLFNGMHHPILRAITLPGTKSFTSEFTSPIKLKTVLGPVNQIRVYIKPKNFSETSVDLLEVQVTLRLENVGY